MHGGTMQTHVTASLKEEVLDAIVVAPSYDGRAGVVDDGPQLLELIGGELEFIRSESFSDVLSSR